MRRLRVTMLLFVLSLLCVSCASRPDLRGHMLQAAEHTDRDFPDGTQRKLTQFAYIGDVTTSDGSIFRIVAARSVITGMLAPRGQAWLSVHD
ncbi:MAG: hypothetical protein JWQ42_4718, partial [Edaphobacter sp.]|nr:hypothetical protein [Edaphobacter sp.]